MAAWRYEISLLVFQKISVVRGFFVTLKERAYICYNAIQLSPEGEVNSDIVYTETRSVEVYI